MSFSEFSSPTCLDSLGTSVPTKSKALPFLLGKHGAGGQGTHRYFHHVCPLLSPPLPRMVQCRVLWASVYFNCSLSLVHQQHATTGKSLLTGNITAIIRQQTFFLRHLLGALLGLLSVRGTAGSMQSWINGYIVASSTDSRAFN